MEKKTLKEMYQEVIDVVAELVTDENKRNELIDFLEDRMEKTVRKNKSNVNDELKSKVLEALKTFTEPVQVKDLVKHEILAEEEVTGQKISPRLKALVEEGLVEKTGDKKTSLYKAV